MNRRTFTKLLAASPLLTTAGTIYASGSDEPDIDIDLTAGLNRARIIPGSRTEVWSYDASLRKGPESTLTQMQDSYLGPVIRVHTGQRVRIRYVNNIPRESTVHWHGLCVPEEMDGHPRDEVSSGSGSYTYEFTVIDRGGTYWYHPHPYGLTGEQVYRGLAGLFIVDDEDSLSEELPQGEYDIPLVIQDRTLAGDGSLVYFDRDVNEHELLQGFLGNTIVVNGQSGYNLPVKRATYRFRLLNASNSRIYKLYLDNGSLLTVIGTDGGLLAHHVTCPYLVIAPGERYEILVDFSRHQVNSRVALRSMDFAGGMLDMGFMEGSFDDMDVFLGNGTDDFPVMSFAVMNQRGPVKTAPDRLSTIPGTKTGDGSIADYRRFEFEMAMMNPIINGMSFELERVESWEIVQLDTTEIWEFVNMTPLPVPVHVHGVQFRVIGRDGISPDFDGYKDTVLLMSSEMVRVLISFTGYEGPYLYHSQNLEHADMGMMRNYLVEP